MFMPERPKLTAMRSVDGDVGHLTQDSHPPAAQLTSPRLFRAVNLANDLAQFCIKGVTLSHGLRSGHTIEHVRLDWRGGVQNARFGRPLLFAYSTVNASLVTSLSGCNCEVDRS